MGKVIAIEHLTLRCVMQAPGHLEEDPRGGFRHGGWVDQRQDPAMQEVMGAHMSSMWSLLAGRTTYERSRTTGRSRHRTRSPRFSPASRNTWRRLP